ncbi:MAG: FKBP-type peptidyl-prolyl cis-trans isomerase [Labilibaculum antarcticum]
MKYSLLALCFAFLVSCDLSSNIDTIEPQEEIDYTEQNEAEIIAYVAANNLDAIRSNSGLYYVIDEPGTGEQPTGTSTVTVAYKGYYLNGTLFDESGTNGVSFGLDRVIEGWTEGIAFFKEGGNGILLVPAHLGYGNYDYSTIPGGSVLIFDINLISIDE